MRGNRSTRLDTRHPDGAARSESNLVRLLIHGSTYFGALHHGVSQMRDGDLLMFIDWCGDSDERLTDSPDSEAGKVFADAAQTRRRCSRPGEAIRGPPRVLRIAQNRRLGDEINDAGGQCLLDMRVGGGDSHHQKFVVLRHGNRPGWTSPF
jgi:hypothetical protein